MGFFESIFYMAWRGIAIGLIISAPMGPVGMLCIQRTLDKGRRAGFYTGIGAALSDLFYSLLTGFGLSFIEEFLERNSNIIQLAGCAVLIAFGVYLFKKNPARTLKKPVKEEISVKKNILGGFLFTFSNPLILFLIVGLFARFNFLLPDHHVGQYFTGFLFIFIGAIIWWWFITFSIDKVRSHFNIRSMWLINKIIGVIILLFAVVGIFTATSALVKGADMKCWNDCRGFDSFSPLWQTYSTTQSPGLLANTTPETITLLNDENRLEYLEFRFKAKNLHNNPNKTYSYTSPDGKSKKVSMPVWGIILKSEKGDSINFEIDALELPSNGFEGGAAINIKTFLNGKELLSHNYSDQGNIITKLTGKKKGIDSSGGTNFYKIILNPQTISLYGGIHTPELLFSIDTPPSFTASGIGYFLSPGAAVEFSEMRLSGIEKPHDLDPWCDMDLTAEYLENTRDRMEGYWQVLDRSIDEDLFRLGGDYRFAIVRSNTGYDLLYISGAKTNSNEWQSGMVKAHLLPSGIDNLWNVTWYDAMHQPLSHELKAQTDANGTLLIQFPYQSSTIRLHHSSGRE